MLLSLFATMKMITIIFGLWMLLTGLHILESGIDLKKDHSFGWIILILGALSVLAGVMMIFDIGTGATGVSILFGVQVLVAGIALIIFAFVKKAVVSKVKTGLKTVYSNFND
jgi:uncharacterized membrane protein HdeD (DUF308 family)